MRSGSMRKAVLAFALFSSAHSADAHGIAGNRFFVGTLTFDDPSVADEAVVPNFSTLNQPVEGGRAVDNRPRALRQPMLASRARYTGTMRPSASCGVSNHCQHRLVGRASANA